MRSKSDDLFSCASGVESRDKGDSERKWWDSMEGGRTKIIVICKWWQLRDGFNLCGGSKIQSANLFSPK